MIFRMPKHVAILHPNGRFSVGKNLTTAFAPGANGFRHIEAADVNALKAGVAGNPEMLWGVLHPKVIEKHPVEVVNPQAHHMPPVKGPGWELAPNTYKMV
jgi:hypothetical protein